MRAKVANDLAGRALLELPQRGLVRGEGVGLERRPAQQRVGVEVAQEHVGDGGADGREAAAAVLGVVVGDVQGAAHDRRQRDQVALGGLLGRGEEVPLEREGVCQVGLRERHVDYRLGGRVPQRPAVEVDLVGA